MRLVTKNVTLLIGIVLIFGLTLMGCNTQGPGYELTVVTEGEGNVDVSPAKDLYSAGEVVNIAATADDGWLFSHWEGSGMDGETDPSIQITMNTDVSLQAIFRENENRSVILHAVADTFVNQNFSGINYGDSDTIFVVDYPNSEKMEGLVRFDLSHIPAGVTITNAYLKMFQNNDPDGIKGQIAVYEVLENWDEMIVTWNNKPATSSEVVDSQPMPLTEGWIQWDVTALVQNWLNENNGLLLSTDSNSLEVNYFTYFDSKESGGLKPELVIEYEGATRGENQPPGLNVTSSMSNLTVTVNGEVWDDTVVSEVIFDWGDGQRDTYSLDVVYSDFTKEHTYDTVGDYTITVTVIDNEGLETAKVIDVTVAIVGGTENWKIETGDYISSAPALDQAGNIYIASADDYLYSLAPDGTKNWDYFIGAGMQASPVIDTDGTIYAANPGGTVYALNQDGTVKWQSNLNDSIDTTPALGENDALYVGCDDANLYSLDLSTGELNWNFETSDAIRSGPVVDADGTIYVSSTVGFLFPDSGTFYAVNPDGTQKWLFETMDYIISDPAIGTDGTIYVGSNEGLLYAINPDDGTEKWRFDLGGRIEGGAVIGEDGTIYIGSSRSIFYALNPNGTKKWQMDLGSEIYNSALIGSDGYIYVSAGDELIALTPDGSELWSYTAGGNISTSCAISDTGVLYFGAFDHYVYAIESSSSGLVDSAWPMFRHDNQHTSRP